MIGESMDLLWLGYDGLDVQYADVAAVLFYRPDLDDRIASSYGSVPQHIRAVVVTQDGHYLPSRWRAEQIRMFWAHWRLRAEI